MSKDTSTKSPEFVIISSSGSGLSLKEIYRYRHLLYYIIYKDVVGKYKQAILGIGWKLLTPFLNMVVLTLLFGVVAKLPSEPGLPYALLVYSGTLGWNLFATIFNNSANSVLANAALLTKVYFPRMLLPLSSIGEACMDFGVAMSILIALMLYYGYTPGWVLLLLPLAILLCIIAGLSVGLFFAAILPKYRDFGYLCPFVLSLWMMLSPVAYLAQSWPESIQWIIALNPMVGVIEFARWCILGGGSSFSGAHLSYSIVFFGLLLIAGVRFFLKRERHILDVL